MERRPWSLRACLCRIHPQDMAGLVGRAGRGDLSTRRVVPVGLDATVAIAVDALTYATPPSRIRSESAPSKGQKHETAPSEKPSDLGPDEHARRAGCRRL